MSSARQWFSQDPFSGHRFWFGQVQRRHACVRNRGQRLRSGRVLKKRLIEMDRDWDRALDYGRGSTGRMTFCTIFRIPEGSEMWSRWDMQSHPPDILITNYSMLNVMLMRRIESGTSSICTKAWLEADRTNHVFHLVVDELHTYRGTPGTEVGYLLRTFLHRIGLHSGFTSTEDHCDKCFHRERRAKSRLPGTVLRPGWRPHSKYSQGRHRRFPASRDGYGAHTLQHSPALSSDLDLNALWMRLRGTLPVRGRVRHVTGRTT